MFNDATVPSFLRGKFAVADRGELRIFETRLAALDAAYAAMQRDVGPINAAYLAATDEMLPTPFIALVDDNDDDEEIPLVAPVRMARFEETGAP